MPVTKPTTKTNKLAHLTPSIKEKKKKTPPDSNGTYLNGVLPLRESDLSLSLLLQDERSLVLGESPTDGAGLLCSEIKGEVLLALVEQAELSALVRVDDGENAGDGLAEVVAVVGKERLDISFLWTFFFVCGFGAFFVLFCECVGFFGVLRLLFFLFFLMMILAGMKRAEVDLVVVSGGFLSICLM